MEFLSHEFYLCCRQDGIHAQYLARSERDSQVVLALVMAEKQLSPADLAVTVGRTVQCVRRWLSSPHCIQFSHVPAPVLESLAAHLEIISQKNESCLPDDLTIRETKNDREPGGLVDSLQRRHGSRGVVSGACR
jgi:hypothetical protein